MNKKIVAYYAILTFILVAIAGAIWPQPVTSLQTSNYLCLVFNNPTYVCTVPTATPVPTPTPVPTATPVPTPTPTPVANCTYGQFSAPNHYPDSCWVPWSATSVWNKPISSYTTTVASSGTTWTNYYTSQGGFFPMITGFGGNSTSSLQYGHPIYFGQSTDATYTVTCTQSYASECPTGSYHIPSYAKGAGGWANDSANSTDYGDHHLAVLDQVSGIEVDCWRAQSLANGRLTCDSSSAEAITGDGLNGQETRSGYRLTAGIIRDQELIAGVIPHALFLVVPCTNSGPSVYPAVYLTGSDSQCASNQGAPYGSWMQLNMTDAQIAALNAPTYRKAIYTALAHYGAFIADSNGGNAFGFQVESDQSYISSGYTNSGCPTNGASCTPASAYFHSLGDPGWNGSQYIITLNDITWNNTTIKWLNPSGTN